MKKIIVYLFLICSSCLLFGQEGTWSKLSLAQKRDLLYNSYYGAQMVINMSDYILTKEPYANDPKVNKATVDLFMFINEAVHGGYQKLVKNIEYTIQIIDLYYKNPKNHAETIGSALLFAMKQL